MMQLLIKEGGDTEQVKAYFSACYPFLKIELYRLEKANENVLKKNIAVTQRFYGLWQEGTVDIAPQTTIEELEQNLAPFGLSTKIFRRSGNVWVGTSLTDNWTLQQQNTEGEEISSHI